MNKSTMSLDIRPIKHISYSVTYNDLITTWIDLYHRDDNIVIIFDPNNHAEFLRECNIDIIHSEVYESKILTVQVSSLEDGMYLLKSIPHTVGPYVQLWALGVYVTDNIEK